MAANNSTETPICTRLFTLSTTVEEAQLLLESYVELMQTANGFSPADAEQAGRASKRMFALLVAAEAQLDKLRDVSGEIMQVVRDIRPREA